MHPQLRAHSVRLISWAQETKSERGRAREREKQDRESVCVRERKKKQGAEYSIPAAMVSFKQEHSAGMYMFSELLRVMV